MKILVRLGLILAMTAGTAAAQDTDVEDGRDLFLYFCAECHGKDAASEGPTAEILAIDPPVLTNLAGRNEGVFPVESVAMQVDGRMPIAAHSYMPVFGPSLDGDQLVSFALPSGQPMMVTQHLGNLITYLMSVQVQAD